MKKFLLSLLVALIGATAFAQESPSDLTILKMVKRIKELNFLDDKCTIYPGQLLLCEFYDNKFFQFYELVKTGDSVWKISERLLIVTSDYHKDTKEKLALPKEESIVVPMKKNENISSVASSSKYEEPTVLQKILCSVITPLLFMFVFIKIHNIFTKKKET